MSTAIFSLATGLSRIAGLVREIVAAYFFGVTAQHSAFKVAFNLPNLVRSLFADAALQAAFVPVFTELLGKGQRREAAKLVSTLFYIILLGLGAITALFILIAPWILPLFAPGYSGEQLDLAVNLSRLLFPIVLMLGITGLFAGVLNSFDHFGVPAIAPLFWNIAIIAAIIGLVPVFPEGKQIYAYAIGVLIGTLIQMLMPLPLVRSRLREFKFGRNFDARNPLVKRVFVLMLPVTIGLGLINFDVTINNSVATLVGDGESAPAAIDFAFRVFMLPQGIFSVAIATVLFPTLARAATRLDMAGLRSSVGNGMRQMYLLLVPSAVVSAILAEPIIRLLFENGTKFQAEDTALVATALFWFAFSMPFQGSNLLLTRTFFALRRPWATTVLALGSLLVNLGLSLLLYKPYGVAGIVGATAVSTFGMTVAQAAMLRGPLNGIEATATITTFIKIAVASVPFGLVTYGLWYVLDDTLGRSTWGQIASLGPAFAAGAVTYGVTVYAMRIPEARQIFSLLSGRFRGSAA